MGLCFRWAEVWVLLWPMVVLGVMCWKRERDDEVERERSERDGHGGARGSERSGFHVSGSGKESG